MVRAAPFHCTTELLIKLVPLTVRVKAVPPAEVEAGLIPVIPGAGLSMLKFRELEVPPPGVGLNTVTAAIPAVPTSPAGIDAINWVEER